MPKALAIQINWQFTSDAGIMQVESIFDESGEGSNLVTSALTFWETSLVWTEQTFDCERNALECKTLQELVTHTQQWDWMVVSCQTRIFSRFFNSYHLGLSPDFRDGMCSHDSGEKFGQPGASFGAQVLHEFHMDVVVTWNCRWFRLLQSSWNLLFSEWIGKTLVCYLLQKSSALHTNLPFELLVVQCFSSLDEISGNGVGADWQMCWLGQLLSSTNPAYQCPTLPAWVREVHLRRQFFSTMPASCI